MADDDINDALLKRGSECESQPLIYPPSISTNQFSLKQVLVILVAYLTVGTICFSLIQDQISGKKTNKIIDAVYFCVITMTAAGYGDVGPETNLAKSLACIFVFTGMALGGFVLSKAADYIVGKQEILFVKAIHMRETYGQDKILKEAETYKVKYKFLTILILIIILVTIGTLFLSLVEKLSYFEAFYCVCATITTLGYGDKSFSTQPGRLFAIFWILITTVSLAQLFVYLVELWTDNRRRVLVHWVLNRKLTIQDLEKADLDNDKVVSVAEYVLYKLREMGKVSDEDIATVAEGFKNLDKDHSGTLTANDIKLVQSFEAHC
uniref:two-pore potassium channel 1-like n=1 Tax=Erigeron canadensis TaxID=72917 RepID=UPI001CB9BA47|nr:two-pore potassium channel 1-like [Erigeron canadensis]